MILFDSCVCVLRSRCQRRHHEVIKFSFVLFMSLRRAHLETKGRIFRRSVAAVRPRSCAASFWRDFPGRKEKQQLKLLSEQLLSQNGFNLIVKSTSCYERRFRLGFIYLGSESDIASRWVHREPNLMFT